MSCTVFWYFARALSSGTCVYWNWPCFICQCLYICSWQNPQVLDPLSSPSSRAMITIDGWFLWYILSRSGSRTFVGCRMLVNTKGLFQRGTVELKKYLRSRMEEPETAQAVAPKKESVLPTCAGDSHQAHEMQQSKTMDYRSEVVLSVLFWTTGQNWYNFILCWRAI